MNKKNPIEMIKAANEAGEPTFTFRAKDKHSLSALHEIARIIVEFKDWQKANPGKVKLPD